jgi:predicted acylesterase/phospholipase RssA
MATIEHLVLSAGGHNGFKTYGAARQSARAGMWRREDLKSIYGSSAGAVIGAMLAMGYEWDWLDDYLIKRPWDTVLAADERMLDAYAEGGVYGADVMAGILGPLLEAKGFPLDITMSTFAERTGVALHVIATDINTFSLTKVVLAPDTTPDCPLVTAVAASAAYPLLFRPVHYDGRCLIDGAMLSLYPVSECLESGCKSSTVLGFRNDWSLTADPLPERASMFDVANAVFRRALHTICSADHRTEPPSDLIEIVSQATNMNYESMRAAVTDPEVRRRLVAEGAADGDAAAAAARVRPAPAPLPPTERSPETGAAT